MLHSYIYIYPHTPFYRKHVRKLKHLYCKCASHIEKRSMGTICSFCEGPFQQACSYLAAWVACSCSSVLSLVTPATISSTVHCRVAWEKIRRSVSIYIIFLAYMNPSHDSQSDLSVYMAVLRSFLKWRSGLFRKGSHVSPFEHLVIFPRFAELYVDLHSPAAKLLKSQKKKKKKKKCNKATRL